MVSYTAFALPHSAMTKLELSKDELQMVLQNALAALREIGAPADIVHAYLKNDPSLCKLFDSMNH